jgi:Flp pilus assembly protein TadD
MDVVRIARPIIAAGLAVTLGACVVQTAEEGGELGPGAEAALSDSLLEAAQTAERSLDYAAAADHYARLYERDPDRIEALIGQARNLRYDGHGREAVKALRAGIETHGETVTLLLELAKAQFAAAMIADSSVTMDKLMAMEPDNWEVLSMMAMLRDRGEDFAGARELYRRALELSPGNPSVINNYSLSLAQAGRLDEAIETLEPLARGEKSTLQARQNLVMLYVIKGDMEKAEKLAHGDLPPDKVMENLSAYQALVD